MGLGSYRELVVWQKSIELVKLVYKLTELFPEKEKFGLTTQLRRAAISIPSNIAEGYTRKSRREYAQFINVALGPAAELETQLHITRELSLGDKIGLSEGESLVAEIMRMLYVLLQKVK